MAKKLKVGIHKGGGAPPGYLWSVFILDAANKEAEKFLNEEQYLHLADQFQEMARCAEPLKCPLVSLDQIEDFWELKDKGGPLGNLNVRVYFLADEGDRRLVVLGAVKKEADGQAPQWIKIRIRRRKRQYENGELSEVD